MPKQKPVIHKNETDAGGPAPPWKILPWLLTRRRPKLPVSAIEPGTYPKDPCAADDLRIYFVGHCTLLIEVHGRYILTDPIFSDFASPVQGFGPRRVHPPGIRIEDLPPIDLVLISHNHYDHLDYNTIKRLGNSPKYIIPEGLTPWFDSCGITNVHELPWWEHLEIFGVKITATPCQHWSRRTPFDTCHSHWNGYAMEAGILKFLFIGDSGYCDAFRRIGERLGPFHVVALPIGAYDPPHIMREVHMDPIDALQAFTDVRGTILVPTHYGCFPLTDEPFEDPPILLYQHWVERGLAPERLWLLSPGQHRSIEDMIYIPMVRHVTERKIRQRRQSSAIIMEPGKNDVLEWSIAICPFKGNMVDLQAIGSRIDYYDGEDSQALSLNHLRCSGYGELSVCGASVCPLRDPSFLRAHDLHGHRISEEQIDVFAEVEFPPEPKWWKEKLRIIRTLE